MKTLAIINEKGGVGKSFIATQFAYFCRLKLGLRVLVVDLDTQNNSGEILSRSGICSYANVSSGEIMLLGKKITTRAPFQVVPGDDSLLDLEKELSEDVVAYNLNEALSDVSEVYDICILDCAPSADCRQLAALSVSTHYLIPFQVKQESISGVDKTLSRASIVQEAVNTDLQFLGLLMSMVKLQGIQKSNFDAIIKSAGNLLIRRFDPRDRTEKEFCCILDRSVYTEAQQYNRPVFFSENGVTRKEAAELNRVWVTLVHKLQLPVNNPVRIAKDAKTGLLKEITE